MPRDTTIKATIDIGANITGFQNEINKVRIELSKLSLTDGMKDDFKNLFANLESEIKNIQNKTGNKELSIVDEKSVAKSFDRIGSLWQQLNNRISSSKVQNKLLDADQKSLDKLTKIIKDYNRELNNSESNIGKAAKAVREQAAAAEKLEKDLRKQTELQSLYNDRVSKNRAVEEIQQEINETKKLVQERERIIELAEKEVKTRVQTEEEFKAEYKNKSGTKSGWKAAYDKAQRNGTLPEVKEVQDLTQAYEELAQARRKSEELKTELSSARSDSSNLDKASRAVEDLGKQSESAKTRLKELNDNLAQAKSDAFEKVKDSLVKMTDIPWDKFGIDPENITSFEILEEKIEEIRAKGGAGATETIEKINEALVASRSASNEAVRGFDQASGSIHEMSESAKQLDQMRNNILQFFSIGNAVRLFKRAIRSAMDTVKDLDKVMTETAVVTEFSVGDMWTQLPEYTKRANELGVSIHDVYEASTLYYQQGLKTNEVMAVTNATLRMARIAGLDAAEATDRVTNALRGFNMEINEANADNIADVYSKLAAISASDVDEISVAMTKVASLANSANMQFENTAAFLAQIIETTRESAETAGTALKTVVARFSEVKDLYSKGELLGTDEEGEEIDVNKVSKALRTAGINLNEFLVGQKGLDEIFMELASKWDDLDIVQQRYIATMAAGSRQQSRFIALMSDYRRTQELTTAAQDANGAATEQYNKTLESLETKLTKLKNAWDQFLMSITNSDIIKGAVDMLTGLINALNKVIDTISGGNGLLKSIAAITISVGGLKLGRSLFNSLLGNPITGAKGWLVNAMAGLNQPRLLNEAGEKAGNAFLEGFKSLKGLGGKNILQSLIGRDTFSAQDVGIKEIDFRDTRLNFSGIEVPQDVIDSLTQQFKNIAPEKLNDKWQELFDTIQTGDFEKARKQAADLNVELKLNQDQLDKTGQTFKATGQQVQAFGQTLSMVGGLLIGFSAFLQKVFPNASSTLTKTIRNIGVALMTIPSILRVVSGAVSLYSKEMAASIMSIPVIGWIAAIVSAVIAATTVIMELTTSFEEAAQNAQDALDAATEAAIQAADAVDNLNDSYSKIIDSADKLSNLTQGTKEWQTAIQDNNKAVLDLLSNYRELQIVSNNGMLEITNFDEVAAMYQKRQQNLQYQTFGSNIDVVQTRINNTAHEMRTNAYDSDYVWLGKTNDKEAFSEEQYKQIAKLIADGTLKTVEEANKYLSDKYANGESVLGLTDDSFKNMREFGNSILESNRQLEVYYSLLGQSAIEYSNLTESQQVYSEALIENTKYIQKSYEDFSESLANKLSKEDDTIQEAYREWVRETFGSDIHVKSNGKFIDSQGEEWAYNDAKTISAFSSWYVATNDFNKRIEKSAKYLEELSGIADEASKSFAKVYEGSKGDQLKRSDLDNLEEEIGINFDSLTIEDLIGEERLKNYFESNQKLKEAFGNDFDSWAETFATNIIMAQDTINKAYGDFNNEQFKEATDEFGASTIEALTNQLATYRPNDDGEFGASVIERIGKLIGTDLTDNTEDLEKAVKAFSTVALNSEEDLDNFKDTLKSLGFNVADSEFKTFIDNIKDEVHALVEIDIEKITEQLPDLSKVVSDIREGEQGRYFSKDTYDKINEIGVDMSEFVRREDGSYIYLGDKLDNIVDAINEQTGELLGRGKTQLEAKEAAWGLTSDVTDMTITRQVYDTYGNLRGAYEDTLNNREYLNEVISRYDKAGLNIGDLGIKGLYNNLAPEIIQTLTDETINSWVTQFKEIAANQAYWQDKLKGFRATEQLTALMGNTLETLVQGLVNNPEMSQDQQELYKNAIFSKASTTIPEDILNSYIGQDFNSTVANEISGLVEAYQKINKEGLDIESVKMYAQALKETQNIALSTATEVSIQNAKLNQGVKNIIESYDDWGHLIEDGILGSGKDLVFVNQEDFQNFENLKAELQTTLNLTTELSDEFFTNSENMAALTQLAVGDAEAKNKALVDLANAAALDVASTLNIVGEDYEWLVNFIESIDLEPLEVGAIIEDEEFINELNRMVAMADGAGAQIAEGLGFHQEKYQTGSFRYYLPPTRDELEASGGVPNLVYRDVPTYGLRWVRSGGIGGGSTKHQPISYSNQNRMPSSVKSSSPKAGSGGSEKEEKSNQWLNPYDELYNLQQKINTALRERERLEHRYEDMLKDHTKTANDLVENTLRETASLKQQLALQKQMLAGRQRQVQNVANEKYEDSEGNITTLGAVGATRYASYDLSTNTVQIDYDAIDQIVDENLGKAVEQYVSRLEELQGEIVDTEDAIEEINDQLIEIQDRGKEEYLNFEQKVYDALVARREAEIEALENINSSITDAANKTITAIQDEVAKERQARENAEKEQDIRDKEMRLAYLQRDTSGANDLEILKLQKEISNDQQSYQDQIIDQTIQEMQEEATRAEQQRQAQIDLLRDLLEHEKRYGMFWTDVESKLSGAFDANGKIKVESDLYQLLKEDANFQALSKLKSFQWTEDITKEIAIAIQGLQNYTLAEAKSSSGKLTLNDGTTLTYDAKTGTWYDSKTKKTYTDGDLYWDYNKQAYSLKATNATQAARPATTTTSTTAATTPAKTTTSTSATTTPQQTPKNSEPAKLGRITNTYGWVNVRSTVAYGNNVIGHTEKGQSFDVIGYGDYGWYKIKLPNGQIGYTAVHQNGTPLYAFQAYKQGGLADFTGPAWLDGTKSRPEMVLNAADTQNFIALKDILASILKNTSSTKAAAQTGGDNYFDIDIQAEIDSDYDVDQLAERIKKQIYDAAEYRNVNAISLMR